MESSPPSRPDLADSFARASDEVARSFLEVTRLMLTALCEVAYELGGEELVTEIMDLARSSSVLPNPAALKRLDEIQAGSAERVMRRTEELQEAEFARDEEVLKAGRVRRWGQALLRGMASLNIAGR